MTTREFDLTDELLEELQDGDAVDTQNWRHGQKEAHVFKRDGEHWLTWIDVHNSEGWQFYGKTIRATMVEAKFVMVTKWVPVKEAAPSGGPA